jgi:lysophospholipase
MSEPAPLHADVAEAPEGGRAFWLTAADGVRLRAGVWPSGRRGTAVIFPGRTEYIEKYGRVVGRLAARGLSAVVIDWRGQGLSDRQPSSPVMGHVEDFRDYQRDVAALLEHDAVADLPGPRYLLAHSMGGCIALRTLLERADFCGAVLSAPMWHLQMRAATRELTSRVTQLARLVGLGSRLTPGARPQPTALAVAFEGNALTSDPERFAAMASQITVHPELALGGPTMQWTYAALEEMARLYVAPLPKLPVLVFLGTDESVVSASIIRSQVAKLERGELVLLEGARHEILMERPAIQAAVWARIDGFLDTVPERRARPAAAGA